MSINHSTEAKYAYFVTSITQECIPTADNLHILAILILSISPSIAFSSFIAKA
ncbi:TPA: hypothetical protein ACX6QF_003520 [Photobacterium damselae]|uniref:hypothetical protein n=1 Tax=Photobacterium damselae TaxID=38293 RepID=UPI000314976B|nr:hypothetical protein [Photobacterium damselae]MCG3813000.1 hypothetical protein [Photobacterium damselae]UKA02206.1 hypothetical protein IHC89_02045 [Photobacterium damselae subsp. damselae]